MELLLHVDFSKNVHQIKGYVLENRRVKNVLSRYIIGLRTRARKTKSKRFENEFQKMAAEAPNIKVAVKKTWPKIVKDLRGLWLQCNEKRGSTPGPVA